MRETSEIASRFRLPRASLHATRACTYTVPLAAVSAAPPGVLLHCSCNVSACVGAGFVGPHCGWPEAAPALARPHACLHTASAHLPTWERACSSVGSPLREVGTTLLETQ